MVRRLKKHSWGGWIILLVLMVLVVVQYWLARINSDRYAAPERLSDGRFRIEKVIDPITFHVRALDNKQSPHPFRLRLAGVQIPREIVWKQPNAFQQLCQTTLIWVGGNEAEETGFQLEHKESVVDLEFDRYHTTGDRTAIAHLLVNGERLNIKLAELGLVLPDPIPGNSPSIERKIRLASQAARNQHMGMFQLRPPIEQKKSD